MADIDIRDDRPGGRLEAFEDGDAVGAIGYFALDATPPALVAVHTAVDEAHQGKGIGSALVRHFYRMAAAEDVPVVPLCPYAAQWAQRHPDEASVPPADLVMTARRQLKEGPRRW
jgi:predicted GNAT family acetyltransferase